MSEELGDEGGAIELLDEEGEETGGWLCALLKEEEHAALHLRMPVG